MLAKSMPVIKGYDVLVQAGHEGRPQSCARFPRRRCNLGAPGERAWTPIVANAATRILEEHGVRVARVPADYVGFYDVDAAVFIHFDGATPPCSSAASVGYPARSDRRIAGSWKSFYGRYFPFGFRPDNFTVNLHRYYGFRQVRAEKGTFVLELGEITCPRQKAWLAPRLHWEGAMIAAWLMQLIGRR
jgi:hypothetical protein